MPTFDKDMGDLEQFFELDLAGFREMRSKAAEWDEIREIFVRHSVSSTRHHATLWIQFDDKGAAARAENLLTGFQGGKDGGVE